MEPQNIDVLALYKSGGWLLGTIAALFSVVQTLRASHIQKALPPRWQWESWPIWLRVVVVFVASLVGGVLTAMAGGASWTTALMGGVITALGAMGTHQTLKSLPAYQVDYKADEKVSLRVKSTDVFIPKMKPQSKLQENKLDPDVSTALGHDNVGPVEM